MAENESIIKPTARFEDLRGILRYVPQFRQRVFVIAIDGALMHQPTFASLLQAIIARDHGRAREVLLAYGQHNCQLVLATLAER